MDKLRRMEIFDAVAETGQFTRAAKLLRLSKSAVSHGVTDLENHLQVQLITRSSRGLQLTEAGRIYHQKCRDILASVDGLEEDTRQLQKIIRGRIRISAPTLYGALNLVPIISRFSALYPDINIEMDMSERKVDILEEGFDLAIRIGSLADSALVARKLSTIKSILCASPEFRAKHMDLTHISDLREVNCLRYTGTPVWDLYRNGKRYSVEPRGTILSNNGAAVSTFAIAGCGAAFIPEFLCKAALADGSLVRLLPDYDGRSLDVHVLMPPHKHRPVRVRRFLDFLVDNFEKVNGSLV